MTPTIWRAIHIALDLAGIGEEQIASISAHGTGTLYNDGMEMLAFQQVFSSTRPTWSIKGGIGHSMGATGLLETLLVLKSFEEGFVPPTVGLREPDAESAGWVSPGSVAVSGDYALSTNAGFGGVNAALVLRKPEGMA
jgi:3-oxoacyl-[acyl-carrier-protein] synthase II